jgi:hypothetical protein
MSSLLSEVSFSKGTFCCFQHKQQKLATQNKTYVTAENLKLVNHQIEPRPKSKWLGSGHSPVKSPFLSQTRLTQSGDFQAVFSHSWVENKCGGQEIKQPLITTVCRSSGEKKVHTIPCVVPQQIISSASAGGREVVVRHATYCRCGHSQLRGAAPTFLWVSSEGGLLSAYYGLLPYCKTMRWLAADMSGATASPWHQMLSRTCCRVCNGRSCRPRHVISTCIITRMFCQSCSVQSWYTLK